jgi:hypothetical protein
MARAKGGHRAGRMEVIGTLRRMPQLLREHHLVISRAEAGLVQEAIAARCPMIVPDRFGSEEGNFSLLRRPTSARWRKSRARWSTGSNAPFATRAGSSRFGGKTSNRSGVPTAR